MAVVVVPGLLVGVALEGLLAGLCRGLGEEGLGWGAVGGWWGAVGRWWGAVEGGLGAAGR